MFIQINSSKIIIFIPSYENLLFKSKKVYNISLYKRFIAVLLSYFTASCKKTIINFYVNAFPALCTNAIFQTPVKIFLKIFIRIVTFFRNTEKSLYLFLEFQFFIYVNSKIFQDFSFCNF